MSDNQMIFYEDKNGATKINVRLTDSDIWLSQKQIAEIYQTSRENISLHIRNIYADNELTQEATSKKFLLVQQEGARSVKRNIEHYNLDMIIALGYRVQSEIAVRFRFWATKILLVFFKKCFGMVVDRL